MPPTMTTEPDEVSASGPSGLVRELGTIDATMIVMGAMIGSGIFITSAESARMVGSPGWLLVAWALAGLMTIAGALSAAEIAAMMPRAGGQYVFLREAYSPLFGFLFGWAMFLVVQTGTIAAVAVAFAKFLGVFWPSISADAYLVEPIDLGGYAISLSWQQLVALVLIAFLTAVNTCGLKLGKWIQNSFTITKTAALLGLVVLGLALGANTTAAAWTSSWWSPTANGWDPATASRDTPLSGAMALPMLLGLAMIGPLFSQSAWNNVTFTGSRDPEPRPYLAVGVDPRLLDGDRALPAGEPGLCGHAAPRRDPARPGRPCRDRGPGGNPRPEGGADHGRRDPDLDLRVRQRPDPCRGADLLRHGP